MLFGISNHIHKSPSLIRRVVTKIESSRNSCILRGRRWPGAPSRFPRITQTESHTHTGYLPASWRRRLRSSDHGDFLPPAALKSRQRKQSAPWPRRPPSPGAVFPQCWVTLAQETAVAPGFQRATAADARQTTATRHPFIADRRRGRVARAARWPPQPAPSGRPQGLPVMRLVSRPPRRADGWPATI